MCNVTPLHGKGVFFILHNLKVKLLLYFAKSWMFTNACHLGWGWGSGVRTNLTFSENLVTIKNFRNHRINAADCVRSNPFFKPRGPVCSGTREGDRPIDTGCDVIAECAKPPYLSLYYNPCIYHHT